MSSVFMSFNRIGSVISQLEEEAPKVAQEVADVIQSYAVDHVQVLTGETQASIHTEADGNTVSVIAGGASIYLEYGTVHARAFPFLRPAIQAGIDKMQSLKVDVLK